MIWQYDCFYSFWDETFESYETCTPSKESGVKSKHTIDEDSAIRNFKTRRVFSESSVYDYQYYRLGFREVARSNDERTAICCVVPRSVFCVETVKTIRPMPTARMLYVLGIWNSFVFDYYARLKITYHFNFHDVITFPLPRLLKSDAISQAISSRACRLISFTYEFGNLWFDVFSTDWQSPDFWYPSSAPIDTYGPAHEQEIRRRLRDEVQKLAPEWASHCGVHDRLPDRRDTGDRAQLRAEIDAYVAHLYGLSRDDFAYILDTFLVLKKKEKKAFGEFMSKRKCLEEYDRIEGILTAEGGHS